MTTHEASLTYFLERETFELESSLNIELEFLP